LGGAAMYNNSTGIGNVSVGSGSLYNNTTGNGNIVLGETVAFYNTTGSQNIAIGSGTLMTNTLGSDNIAIGRGADVSSANLSNAIAIGYAARVVTSNSIQLGNSSITDVKTTGVVTAAGFKTYSGTSSQYLMADGTVSSSSSSSSGSGLTLLSKIIFVKYATSSLAAEIWTANYDGTSQTKINITLPSGIILGPEYGINLSPNGQKIFFSAGPPYSGDPIKTIEASIYSCNIDGTNVVKIIDRGTRLVNLMGAY
jgi:hypothetical protein